MVIINKNGEELDEDTPILINKTQKKSNFIKKKQLREIKQNKINKENKVILTEAKQLSFYCDNFGKPNKIQLKLSKNGTMYHLHNFSLSPIVFYLGVFISSIMIGCISFFITKSLIASIVCSVLTYIGVLFIFEELNRIDNQNILSDICNIYTILNIDISSGKYINDCLKHIQETVNNYRLKVAFNELIQNLKNRNTTIDESLILFNDRFNSKDLIKLSGYINQMIKNGINEEITIKLSKEAGQIIADINKNSAKKAKTHIGLIANLFIVITIAFVLCFFVYNFNLSLFTII